MPDKNNLIDIKQNNQEIEMTEQEKQLKQVKEAAHKFIDECEGIIIFAFKKGEAEMNGQKIEVPKNLINNEFGCLVGGNVSLPFAKMKLTEILNRVHEQEDTQRASLSV